MSSHQRALSRRGLLVVALLGVAVLGAVRVLDANRARSTAARGAGSLFDEPAPTERIDVGALFPSANVRDSTGAPVPLVEPDVVGVLMINSTSCGFCRQSLQTLGELTQGTPLPGLRVLTLEGAADGRPMLEEARVRGATLVGPGSDAAKVLFTFRIQGTPTFVAVDRRGLVRRIMPGYPGPDELRRWLPLMTRSGDFRAGD